MAWDVSLGGIHRTLFKGFWEEESNISVVFALPQNGSSHLLRRIINSAKIICFQGLWILAGIREEQVSSALHLEEESMTIRPGLAAVLWMVPGAAIMFLLVLVANHFYRGGNPAEELAFKARRADLVSRMQLGLSSASGKKKRSALDRL